MSMSAIRPIDGNLVADMLLNKRNEMTKILEAGKFESGDSLMEDDILILEECYIPLIDEIIKFVFQMPTIRAYNDVDEYGYWEPATGLKMKCSSCHEESYSGRSNFCPHCGIPMKEKRDALARLC